MRSYQIAGPVILIALGFLFLLNNFGFHIPLGRLIGDFWPLFLIVPGVMNILRSSALTGGRSHGLLVSGVMMVTLGGLFLLQNLTDIGFGRTWPLLLIAAGLLGVMRFSNTQAQGGYRNGGFGR
jgi:hypothetical protein